MTLYEIIIACVAGTNLALTLLTLRASSAKAATARLEEMERKLREQLDEHEVRIAQLVTLADGAIDHGHLAEIYRVISGVSAQVNKLSGSQDEMSGLLRQLLGQQLRLRNG